MQRLLRNQNDARHYENCLNFAHFPLKITLLIFSWGHFGPPPMILKVIVTNSFGNIISDFEIHSEKLFLRCLEADIFHDDLVR